MVRAQFGPTVEGDVGCSGGTPSFLGSYGNQRALELCDASGDGEHHAPGQRRRRPRVPQQIEVQRFSPRSSLRCAHTQEPQLVERDVTLAVWLMLDQMATCLTGGGRIEIRGFGSFSLRFRRARIARNPSTGTPVSLPARYAVHFKPGMKLRERLNREPSEA